MEFPYHRGPVLRLFPTDEERSTMRDPTDGGMSILSKETDLPPNRRSPRMDPFVKSKVTKMASVSGEAMDMLFSFSFDKLGISRGLLAAATKPGASEYVKSRAAAHTLGRQAGADPVKQFQGGVARQGANIAASVPQARPVPQVVAPKPTQTAVPQQAISPKLDVTVPQPKPSTPVQPKPLAPSPSASPIPAPDAAIAKTPPPNWPVDTTFAGQSLPPGAAVAKTPPPKIEPSPEPKTPPPPPKPAPPEQKPAPPPELKPAPPEQKPAPPAGGQQPPVDKNKTDQPPAGGQQPLAGDKPAGDKPAGGQGPLDPAERERRRDIVLSGEAPKDLTSYYEATKTQDPAMWKQMALQMGTFMLPQMAAGLLFPDHPMLGMVGAMASQPYLHQLGQKHLLRFDPQQQARAKAAWARGEQSTAFTAAEEARKKQQQAEAAAGAQTPLPQKAI